MKETDIRAGRCYIGRKGSKPRAVVQVDYGISPMITYTEDVRAAFSKGYQASGQHRCTIGSFAKWAKERVSYKPPHRSIVEERRAMMDKVRARRTVRAFYGETESSPQAPKVAGPTGDPSWRKDFENTVASITNLRNAMQTLRSKDVELHEQIRGLATLAQSARMFVDRLTDARDTLRMMDADLTYLKSREKDICDALNPADGGQYRADIISAIECLKRDAAKWRAHSREPEAVRCHNAKRKSAAKKKTVAKKTPRRIVLDLNAEDRLKD